MTLYWEKGPAVMPMPAPTRGAPLSAFVHVLDDAGATVAQYDGWETALRGIEQTILPPLHAGWHVRRKSNHFAAYDRVAREVAELLGVDPWLLNPYFESCGRIDFRGRQGEECLEGYVDEILRDVQAKYKEYGIQEEPFVIIKADAGTYGMGIMSVKSPSEIRELNHRHLGHDAADHGSIGIDRRP